MSSQPDCLAELFTIMSLQKFLGKWDQNVLYYLPIEARVINLATIPALPLKAEHFCRLCIEMEKTSVIKFQV